MTPMFPKRPIFHCFGSERDLVDTETVVAMMEVSECPYLTVNTHDIANITSVDQLHIGYGPATLGSTLVKLYPSRQPTLVLNINLATTSDEAFTRTCQAIELTGYRIVKLEVLTSDYRLSNNSAVVDATRRIADISDVEVWPLISPSLDTYRELAAMGCPLVRVMGSPIGSLAGLSPDWRPEIESIIAKKTTSLMLDGGVGSVSDVVEALKFGFDAVLVNAMLFREPKAPIRRLRDLVSSLDAQLGTPSSRVASALSDSQRVEKCTVDTKPRYCAGGGSPETRPVVQCLVRSLRPSGIAEMVRFADSLKTPLIRLEVGDVDVAPPTQFAQALGNAVQSGRTHYPAFRGEPDLLSSIARKLQHENQLPATPEHILVTTGGSMALFLALSTILEPGDEVLLPEPAWPHHREMIRLAGGKPISVPLQADEAFRPQTHRFLNCLNNRTRAILLNSPNNPTGVVYSRREVEELAGVARSHGIAIISDEEYERFCYRDHLPISPAVCHEQTFACHSFSKTLAIAGLRLGFLYGPPDWIEAASKVALYTTMYCCSVTQTAVADSLESASRFTADLVSTYAMRMESAVEAFDSILGIRCSPAEGSLYIFPDFRAVCGEDDCHFARDIAKRTGVVAVPGSAFGKSATGFLRMSLSAPVQTLKEAARRIERALEDPTWYYTT